MRIYFVCSVRISFICSVRIYFVRSVRIYLVCSALYFVRCVQLLVIWRNIYGGILPGKMCPLWASVLSELGVPPDIKFHAIHRAGRPKPAANESSEEGALSATCPRPILVRFVSRMDADLVWTKRKEHLKSRRFRTVFIDKDLSAESAKERGKLGAAYKKAKELNIERAFIKGKNLIVNGNRYVANTLPEYLLPSKKDDV